MNIIRAGVVMIVYLFVVMVAYFVLSTPVTMILDGFDDASTGAAEPYLDVHIPAMKTVFNMFFALLAAVPITWLIFKVFEREPQWGYYQ